VTAGCGSQPEYFLRPAPLDVLLRKKTGKVTTDNLFGFVSLDSFGTGIPTENLAMRIDHEDSVILDSVKELPIFFFTVPERVFCRVSCAGTRRRDRSGFAF